MNPLDDAPAPAPPPPRGRSTRGPLLALAAVILALGMGSDLTLDAARAIGQRIAGVGTLEWQGAAAWVPIDRADARRRAWGPEHTFLTPPWRSVAPGLSIADLALRRPPNPLVVDIFLARVDPARWRFRVWGTPDFAPGPVGALAAQADLALAVNASYFSDDGPLGLVVTDGAARGRQGKNRAAHFVVGQAADGTDAAPRIVNEKGAVLGPLAQGFQGFPAIMTGGNTYAYLRYGGRGFDVWRVDRRTAACTQADGAVMLLVTDTVTNGLSLAELATVLGGLGCVDAMAFDGGSSTGTALRVEGHARTVPNLGAVPVILGVEER
ncbi:MAG: phosphodiester glycosidase family protein [Pseudomonadota bacterium]|nr:phosphodiester glycosidase family protein [Pseudomonadota bacterium]